MDEPTQAGSALIVIGLWKARVEPYWPDPHDFVDDRWDVAERAAVVLALRSGRTVRAFRGESTCRMCGRLNGATELTDGLYLWPDGLAHYVSDHAVRLPEPVETHFLEQQRAGQRVITGAGTDAVRTGEELDASGREADESWWLGLGSADWT